MDWALLIVIALVGLCWGSFLNVVAYRLVHDIPFFTKRSLCPHCHVVLHWYDLIPVVSWVILRGKCRACKASISCLYPFIECITALSFIMLAWPLLQCDYDTVVTLSSAQHLLQSYGLASYVATLDYASCAISAIFFSALIASTRTDLEAMVIPQLFSIWLVPVAWLSASMGYLPISLLNSVLGAFLGYGILWLIAYSFKRFTGTEGMGVGDMEFLSMIGAFLGPIGVWASVMIGSLTGLAFGALYIFFLKCPRGVRIPFGPFLALGAACYYFWHEALTAFLLF